MEVSRSSIKDRQCVSLCETSPRLLFTVVDVHNASPTALKIIRAGGVPVPEDIGWDFPPSLPLISAVPENVLEPALGLCRTPKQLRAAKRSLIAKWPRTRRYRTLQSTVSSDVSTSHHSTCPHSTFQSKSRSPLPVDGQHMGSASSATHMAGGAVYLAHDGLWDEEALRHTQPDFAYQPHRVHDHASGHDEHVPVHNAEAHRTSEATAGNMLDGTLAAEFARFVAETLAQPLTTFVGAHTSPDWLAFPPLSSYSTAARSAPSQFPVSSILPSASVATSAAPPVSIPCTCEMSTLATPALTLWSETDVYSHSDSDVLFPPLWPSIEAAMFSDASVDSPCCPCQEGAGTGTPSDGLTVDDQSSLRIAAPQLSASNANTQWSLFDKPKPPPMSSALAAQDDAYGAYPSLVGAQSWPWPSASAIEHHFEH
ncbi:unnamed protein product [Peniophora sp. CBMAI 1063]|nr:unnamed protein product [Peniophora sp. CBMAI 1063]